MPLEPVLVDDRCATGLRLDGHDAEILLGSKYKCLTTLHLIAKDIIGLILKPGDVWWQVFHQFGSIGSVANDYQPLLGHSAKGLDDNVKPFIRHQPRCGQIEVFSSLSWNKGICIHWRVECGRIPSIEFLHPAPDKVGIGKKLIGSLGCQKVPVADIV